MGYPDPNRWLTRDELEGPRKRNPARHLLPMREAMAWTVLDLSQALFDWAGAERRTMSFDPKPRVVSVKDFYRISAYGASERVTIGAKCLIFRMAGFGTGIAR